MSKGKSKPPRHKPLETIREAIPAFLEMDDADDRTCAIVGLAFVENNLVLCLMKRFVPLDEKAQRNLFDEPQALLSTFAVKVELGFLLNIYGQAVRDDLRTLARIRNRFAHYLEVRGFDHPEVADLCDKLAYPAISMIGKARNGTRRERYAATVSHFIQRFALEATHDYRPAPSHHRIVIGADY